ncbi:cytochrome P450 [Streptomyces sp. NPDC051662]|uniref:cytochrome P450 family protein n=1 Tax=Streptomyces sp. NPDC051662 TaxID=3154750 RepID=UPI00341BA691
MTSQPTGCPYRLDPSGSNIQQEAAELRALGPAARVLLPGEIPAWSVTDPGLIRRLLASPDVSKDASRHWPAYINDEIPKDWPWRIWVDVRNALSAYGDEHSRLRRPLAGAFTARRVRALAPQIEQITNTLLDDVEAAGATKVVDIRAHLAWRLPLLVVNALLGVPETMHDDFRDAVGSLFSTDLTPQEAQATQEKVYALIQALIQHKRDNPGDDVTSSLVQAHTAGQVDEKELADSFVLLIGAGHETTVNLLDWAITNLLAHPEQLAMATSGQVPWEQVVDEALRHQAPIASILMRFPTRDITDHETGLVFAAGDALIINYAAAGRAPQHHGERADAFDITRTTAREHLAFGHGAHYCLGAELARLEGRIALAALFARFPSIQLAVEPDQLRPLPSLVSNGHTHLPVRLTA